MRTLFTSDWHFGHVNILKYTPQRNWYLGLKPGADVTDMNEGLVRLWNDQVDDDDLVVVVGDMCMGKVVDTLQYVKRLKGRKQLVMGNHDRPHPIMFKSQEKHDEWVRLYTEAGFESMSVGPHVWFFDGVEAEVSHFPYEGDHSETERYSEYRPDDHGLPLVHGHIHDLWKVNGRQYNVGIDAWEGVMQTPEAIGAYFRATGYAK